MMFLRLLLVSTCPPLLQTAVTSTAVSTAPETSAVQPNKRLVPKYTGLEYRPNMRTDGEGTGGRERKSQCEGEVLPDTKHTENTRV